MTKQQKDEYVWQPVSKTCTESTHWGVHYLRDKQGAWKHQRHGVNCEKTMKHLVKIWKDELDSDGVYMGTIKGNKYPDIVSYEEFKNGK